MLCSCFNHTAGRTDCPQKDYYERFVIVLICRKNQHDRLEEPGMKTGKNTLSSQGDLGYFLQHED
jgi:hypothetical protein